MRTRALAAIGCRILLHACDADDLSSWGYPPSLLPRAGESFDAVTFVGAGHAIRRAAWDGYDEALFFCWEEFDFCLRAIERGWRIRYRGDIAVRHKVSPEPPRHLVRHALVPLRAEPALYRAQMGCWLAGLLPRFAFYLIKGARNGVLTQTLRALPAALRLSSGVTAQRHSPAAHRYLLRNDTAYRDRWISTLWYALPRWFNSTQPICARCIGTMGQAGCKCVIPQAPKYSKLIHP